MYGKISAIKIYRKIWLQHSTTSLPYHDADI